MNFQEQVWQATKRIPRGRVTTYKELAHAIHTKAYRAVGTALNKNPHAPTVPCHRVVNSNGNVGGFAGGTKKKVALLKKEGVLVKNKQVIDFKKKLITITSISLAANPE